MVLFQGDKRLLEKVHSELNTTTNTNRQLEIYGVKSYDELINVIIPVYSSIKGIPGDVTININNLGDKSLKLFINKLKSSPDFDWIDVGQIYYIIYDGVDFIAFGGNIPVKAESAEDIVYISSTILSATNESTSEEITNLFGESKDITAFINALTNNEHILLSAETTAECISVIAQGTLLSETESTDYIEVIDTNGHYKRLEFKRELGVLDTYLSVNIIDREVGDIYTEEDATSVAHLRIINLDRVDSYEDLIDRKIFIKSNSIATPAAAYIILNNMEMKPIKMVKSGEIVDPYFTWATIGQIYELAYNGTEFIIQGSYSNNQSDIIDNSDIARDNKIQELETKIEELQANLDAILYNTETPIIKLIGGSHYSFEMKDTYADPGAVVLNKALEVAVDSSEVNPNEVGDYNVSYTATDPETGNTTTVYRDVHVLDYINVCHKGLDDEIFWPIDDNKVFDWYPIIKISADSYDILKNGEPLEGFEPEVTELTDGDYTIIARRDEYYEVVVPFKVDTKAPTVKGVRSGIYRQPQPMIMTFNMAEYDDIEHITLDEAHENEETGETEENIIDLKAWLIEHNTDFYYLPYKSGYSYKLTAAKKITGNSIIPIQFMFLEQ